MPSRSARFPAVTHVLGLNSGTSIDSLDWALVGFSGRTPRWQVLDCGERKFPAGLRHRLAEIAAAKTVGKEELARLDVELGRRLGKTVRGLQRGRLARHPVHLIASHGQTIGHWPRGRFGASLQIGDPDEIAKQSGIPTVSHFRQGDLAVGGDGAPLTPAVNRILFQQPSTAIAVLNLGGIANLTVIPARGSRAPVWGTDCGPANLAADTALALVDRPLAQSGGHPAARLAARGRMRRDLLETLQAHRWFRRRLPASCGREEFGEASVEPLLRRRPSIDLPDLIATLYAFTAWGVARALLRAPVQPAVVYLAGGGSHNAALAAMLRDWLKPLPLPSIAELGCDPDALEAISFALLGYLRVRGIPVDLRHATGAARAALLGRLSHP